MAAIPFADDAERWASLHRRLLQRIKAAGLDRANVRHYFVRALYVTFIYAVGMAALCTGPGWLERVTLLFIVTFAAFHGGLLAHEIAHRNLSRTRLPTRLLGQYFMSLLAGQAYAHWEWQHLSHHRHTQDAFEDPDLDVELFALTPEAARKKTGFYRWTTRHQAWLLWPLVTLQGLSIRLNTLRFLWARRQTTRLDAVGFAAHLVLWLVVPAFFIGPLAAAVNYAIATWMIGPFLSASFIWNHVGKENTAGPPLKPYAAQRIVGSRDLLARPLYTYMFGALNFHVEHHLAPHVPAGRLAEVRPLLEEMLAEVGYELELMSWTEAIAQVHRHLKTVASAVEPPQAALSDRTTKSRVGAAPGVV